MLFKGVSWKTVTGTFETRLITRCLICDTEARAGASVCLSRWVGIRGRSLLSSVTTKGRKSATGSKPERSHEEGVGNRLKPRDVRDDWSTVYVVSSVSSCWTGSSPAEWTRVISNTNKHTNKQTVFKVDVFPFGASRCPSSLYSPSCSNSIRTFHYIPPMCHRSSALTSRLSYSQHPHHDPRPLWLLLLLRFHPPRVAAPLLNFIPLCQLQRPSRFC